MPSKIPLSKSAWNIFSYHQGNLIVLYLIFYRIVITYSYIFCLFYLYFYKLIENGKWASVRKGEVVQTNNCFVIWALSMNDINFFQILETQINETRKMFPNLLIWSFPKFEMSRYASFVSLVRSRLADNVPKRYKVVVCDPHM